jgi:hypothetical protein
MTSISKESQDILRQAGLKVDENLLLLSPDCVLNKRGVVVRLGNAFFPFDELCISGQYKLQGGLWDKINDLRGDGSRSCAVRVDLSKPLALPYGFLKYAALMYGATFNQQLLDDCLEGMGFVYYNEHAAASPEKATMGVFPRKEDDVVVIYLEALVPPDQTMAIQTSFMHSEYRRSIKSFSHVDGAKKTYSQKNYENRYKANPTIAPHSDIAYDKVFRINGAIPFQQWLDLVTAFFPLNGLIVELLARAKEGGSAGAG